MMLCTLASLKTYLGITTTDNDEILTMLIKQNSAMIENYLNYSLARKVNEAEVHSVNNEQLLLLDNQPIQSVSAVTIGGTAIDGQIPVPMCIRIKLQQLQQQDPAAFLDEMVQTATNIFYNREEERDADAQERE